MSLTTNGYCVVLLTGTPGECERWEGRDEVMSVLGPYDTKDEAERVFLAQPEWAAPHIIISSKEGLPVVTELAEWVRAEAERRGVTVTTILNEAIQAAKDKREQP